MKSFILNLLKFISFSFVFYIVATFIYGSFAPSKFNPNLKYKMGSYGHLYSRINEIEEYNNVDLLFLGSSHAYRGFDTRIFKKNGYKSFNLGSSAQTPLQTNVLLRRYLESLKPDKVIYEVFPNTFGVDGVESSIDLISNDENDIHSLKMAVSVNNIITYNTFLYSSIRDVFKLDDSFKEPKLRGKDTYISGGYVEKDMGFYNPVELEKKKIEINEQQFETFKEIIQLLKEKGIDIILVFAPITKSNYSRHTNILEFDSIMSSYSKYYNFNEMMSLNDSLHFYDSHHLNQKGVEIFNKELIKVLNK